MKKLIVIITVLFAHSIFAQKHFTKTGLTEMKASVAAFEPVEAKNNSTSVVLKADTGDIAALLFIKAFRFKVALMEEHFNENYMDSDKYPKATFRGKIKDFSFDKISKDTPFTITGTLTVRGVKKEVETVGKFTKKGDKILIKALFTVKPQDFEIDIPSIVRKKIAKSIHITLHYELIQKK